MHTGRNVLFQRFIVENLTGELFWRGLRRLRLFLHGFGTCNSGDGGGGGRLAGGLGSSSTTISLSAAGNWPFCHTSKFKNYIEGRKTIFLRVLDILYRRDLFL